MPEAARQHTKAGAKAFAEYFYQHANAVFRDPRSGSLSGLYLPSCDTCAKWEAERQAMQAKGQHYDRDQVLTTTTNVIMVDPGGAHVFITLRQQPARLLDSSGKVLGTTPTPIAKAVDILQWGSHGWAVETFKHE